MSVVLVHTYTQGENDIDQLCCVIRVLGTPSEDVWPVSTNTTSLILPPPLPPHPPLPVIELYFHRVCQSYLITTRYPFQ